MARTTVGLNSDGSGSGYGYGSGDGSGSGDGYGDGYGYGYGYGYGQEYIILGRQDAWTAYHYVRRNAAGQLLLRTERVTAIGEHLHEDEIALCEYGLHASLSPEDARKYRPSACDVVLTKVKVWGRIIIDKDKLVATDRQIIAICPGANLDDR